MGWLRRANKLSFLGLVLSSLFLPMLAEAADSKPVDLGEDSWRQMLTGEWMVEFYAPWCPACRALNPVWNEFSDWTRDLGVTVAKVDITTNPGLSGRFMVTALPTIYHVKEGIFRQYSGGRDRDSLLAFIDNKKWESLTPVSDWKHPDSLQMSTVAQFFRWSYAIRGVHTYLVDSVGIPYWASYALFTLATVLVGSVLGLLIVAFIDIVFAAPKPIAYHKPGSSEPEDSQNHLPGDSSDLADEDDASQSSGGSSKKQKRSPKTSQSGDSPKSSSQQQQNSSAKSGKNKKSKKID